MIHVLASLSRELIGFRNRYSSVVAKLIREIIGDEYTCTQARD